MRLGVLHLELGELRHALLKVRHPPLLLHGELGLGGLGHLLEGGARLLLSAKVICQAKLETVFFLSFLLVLCQRNVFVSCPGEIQIFVCLFVVCQTSKTIIYNFCLYSFSSDCKSYLFQRAENFKVILQLFFLSLT